MSRKTVSRGTTATALAALLTLATAAPSFAAPRPEGSRSPRARVSAWSLFLDMAGWVFGFGTSPGTSKPLQGVTEKSTFGMDPNGNSVAVDPPSPVAPVPTFGGG
jgi:hypothetical protein